MQLTPIDQITIKDRQRKEFAPKALAELKSSIAAHGLIHAIVINPERVLIAGERRLRAIIELHQEGIPITHNGQAIPSDQIPFTILNSTDDTSRAEVEYAENIYRVDLSWQERTEALKNLHDLRREQNPGQTLTDTATEIVDATGKSTVGHTQAQLAEALIVAEYLDDPEVKRARSSAEAYKIVLDRAETKIKAEAVKNTPTTKPSQHKLILGDCLEEMKKLPPSTFDTIIVDPPYGMNADKMGKGEYHLYDDSPDTALTICKSIIREGFRLTKPKALLFLFCDIDHFVDLRTYAAQQAWSCWRQPLIWRKGVDGHSPWGRGGFIRTTELILFASKGQKELIYPGGPDVLDFKRVGRGERRHSAEKPVPLLRHLIKLSTLPGQTVFDPCAGSGASLEAASLERVKAVAIEKEENYYNECLTRLAKIESGEYSSATQSSSIDDEIFGD